MNENPRGVPELILERYRRGELPAAEHDAVAHLMATDGSLRARVAQLTASDDEIRRDRLDAWLAAGIRQRLAQSPSSRASVGSRWRWAIPAAAAVALILAATLTIVPRGATSGSDADGDRIKGVGATLSVYRRTGDGSELLSDGAMVRTGDLLRIGYRTAHPGYGIIVSIDGRGGVTTHLPPDGARAPALTPGSMVLLDQAYELDDAPQWERFYLVTSREPFDVAPVLGALRLANRTDAAAPLPLDPSLDQTLFVLQKDTRP